MNKQLVWQEVNDPQRSAFMQAEEGVIVYEMLYAQRYVDSKSEGYVLYRVKTSTFEQGCIGDVDGKIGIVHGLAIASAQGFHPSVIKKTVEELKELAQKDFELLAKVKK
jgi:hypothetical protein